MEPTRERNNNSVEICQFIHYAFCPKSPPGLSPSKVSVHCVAGIPRSASAICAYLVWAQHMRWQTAYGILRAKRACVCPNPGFQGQLHVWQSLLVQFYGDEQERDVAIMNCRLRHREATCVVEGTRIHLVGGVSSRNDGLGIAFLTIIRNYTAKCQLRWCLERRRWRDHVPDSDNQVELRMRLTKP